MPTRIAEFIWDDWNEERLARNDVTREEIEQLCLGEIWLLRAQGKGKRALYGTTDRGRHLLLVLTWRGAGVYYAIAARDMTDAERRWYEQRK